MNLQNFTEDALIEIYELALTERKYQKYLPNVRKELRDRLNPHEQLVKDFSPYGVIPKMILSTQDFLDSC